MAAKKKVTPLRVGDYRVVAVPAYNAKASQAKSAAASADNWPLPTGSNDTKDVAAAIASGLKELGNSAPDAITVAGNAPALDLKPIALAAVALAVAVLLWRQRK